MASRAPDRDRARLVPPAQLRLLAALTALVAVVLLASAWAAERGLRQRELAQLERDLEREAALVRELVGPAGLDPARGAELQQLAIASSGAVGLRVTLIAADGRVLADSDVPAADLARVENHASRPEVAAALAAGRPGHAVRRSATVERRFLYVAVPGGPGGGALRVATELTHVDEAVAALRGELARAGLLALLAALPLGLLLVRRALRPLREIAEVVGSIADGELDRRLPRGAPDEFGRIAAAVNDMAGQLRARLQELTEDKERLQAVLAGMVEGVLVVDAEQRVVLANPRLRELFGFRGAAAGRPYWEVVRRAEVQQAIADAAAKGEPTVVDVSTEAPDARSLQLHAVRFPASGPLVGVVAVFHDVTEIRRLERMRRDFVANVSHELKTPLTAIRGFAETLGSSELPDAQRQSYLDVILRHAERLQNLIDDLLELSRVEGRQQAFTPSDVDVARLAAGLLRDMRPQLEARRLEASLAPGARGVAFADRRAVEQILTNLLDNACKYTEPGGRVVVRVSEGPGQVRIEVEDTGVGIPPEDLPRVFERFYRVDKARSRDLGGTGLGLAIVKHLAQAQGGEVSVRSRPREGTTFTVVLPRAA
jgi:two-component system phosphate regulon sensor histidine kinase PhoR